MSTPDRALVIAAHGSHRNADSASAAFQHATALVRSPEIGELFGEIQPAFWKEEPELKDVLATLCSREVVVVPLFISDGYFTQQVIPRELGLRGGAPGHELVDGKWVHYAEPIGTHPAMRDVVEQTARRVIGETPVNLQQAALVLVGHGTPRNRRSAQATLAMADTIRSARRFAEVEPVFIEEAPFVSQALDLVRAPDVIIVPYFTADGLHAQEDIPRELGITDANGRYQNPTVVRGRRVWYAPSVGTAPEIASVILERARSLLGAAATPPELPEPPTRAARRAFLAWLRERPESQGRLKIGQLAAHEGAHGWFLTHTDDRLDDPHLVEYHDAWDAHALTRFTEDERHRPLRSAPTLVRGWRLGPVTDAGFCQAVEAFYPGSLLFRHQAACGTLPVVPWPQTAARQSGLFASVARASAAQLETVIGATCATECLKTPRWTPAAPLVRRGASEPGTELVCREACSVLIATVREAVEPAGSAVDTGSSAE